MQFSRKTYQSLKTRLKRRYKSHFRAITSELKHFPESKTAHWLLQHKDEFKEYTPQRWFYLDQVSRLIFFLSHDLTTGHDEEFSEEENEVFEAWNRSEFADIFLKFLNKKKPLNVASIMAAEIFDEHLVAMGNLHLLKVHASLKNYRLQTSLGDMKLKGKITKLLETTLHIDGKELNLLTHSLKEMKEFSTRIEVASRIIKRFSPDSWERFSQFTETIIPIKQKEFVSYSHQELPGTSMINLYDRDFVDLLDDLLHENGHHHLNYYLNLEELIAEPLDNIYYSPWRRTLRPLRGIYHAYFTFFWAYKFFSDMANSGELDSIWYLFSKQEKEKIYWRAVEEYWMLDYTYHDLVWAKKKGLISKNGWNLIAEQRKLLVKNKNKVLIWEKKIGEYKSELKDLKKTLQHNKKKFKKS